MDKIIVIDEEHDMPNQELYEFVKKTYWVVAFRHEKCSTRDWLMSRGRPVDVPNGSMIWRRPTFEEFTEYVKAGPLTDRDQEDYYGKFRRGLDVPALCECGHGEDSHIRNRFLGNKMYCRATCGCWAFREVE